MNSFNEKFVKESLENFLTKSRYKKSLKENLKTMHNLDKKAPNFQITKNLMNLLKKLFKGFPFRCKFCSIFKILKKNYLQNNIFFPESENKDKKVS